MNVPFMALVKTQAPHKLERITVKLAAEFNPKAYWTFMLHGKWTKVASYPTLREARRKSAGEAPVVHNGKVLR